MQKPRTAEFGATPIEHVVLLALLVLAAIAAIGYIGYRKSLRLKVDPSAGVDIVGSEIDSMVGSDLGVTDPNYRPGYEEGPPPTPLTEGQPRDPNTKMAPFDIPELPAEPTETPDTPRRTSTPTPKPAASTTTPAPIIQSTPPPPGVVPPHFGPRDDG